MLSGSLYGLKMAAQVLRKGIEQIELSVSFDEMKHLNDLLNSLMETIRQSQIVLRKNVDELTEELYANMHRLSIEEKKIILDDIGKFL